MFLPPVSLKQNLRIFANFIPFVFGFELADQDYQVAYQVFFLKPFPLNLDRVAASRFVDDFENVLVFGFRKSFFAQNGQAFFRSFKQPGFGKHGDFANLQKFPVGERNHIVQITVYVVRDIFRFFIREYKGGARKSGIVGDFAVQGGLSVDFPFNSLDVQIYSEVKSESNEMKSGFRVAKPFFQFLFSLIEFFRVV